MISHDDRYFHDRFQGIPVKGYADLLERMADHPNIQLLLNTEINDLIRLKDGQTVMNGRPYRGHYIYTGPLDELMGFEHGTLPYRSVNIEFESFPTRNNFQTSSVVNYPNNYDFTRITEYRHFQRNPVQSYTTISREYPAEYVRGETHPFYVIDSEESRTLYASYRQQVNSYGNIHCLGRLGEYRYYDMDDAVDAALSLTKSL